MNSDASNNGKYKIRLLNVNGSVVVCLNDESTMDVYFELNSVCNEAIFEDLAKEIFKDLDGLNEILKFSVNERESIKFVEAETFVQRLADRVRSKSHIDQKVNKYIKELKFLTPRVYNGSNDYFLIDTKSVDAITKTVSQNQKLHSEQDLIQMMKDTYGLKDVGEVAKMLPFKGSGRNKLFKFLRDKGILMSDGSRWNQPYQTYIDSEWFALRLVDTAIGSVPKTLVTIKGTEKIWELVLSGIQDRTIKISL